MSSDSKYPAWYQGRVYVTVYDPNDEDDKLTISWASDIECDASGRCSYYTGEIP
jgi:hypothetical protein